LILHEWHVCHPLDTWAETTRLIQGCKMIYFQNSNFATLWLVKMYKYLKRNNVFVCISAIRISKHGFLIWCGSIFYFVSCVKKVWQPWILRSQVTTPACKILQRN
jgi:hypothetical protein